MVTAILHRDARIDRAANASPIELRMLGNTKEGHQ